MQAGTTVKDSVARPGDRGGALLSLAGICGFLGVAAGAFGAHVLKGKLDAEELGWFQTGVLYHLFHAPMIAVCGLLARSAAKTRAAANAGLAFAAGIVVFSGSLYAMAFGAPRWFGAITPLGGLLLLAGWAALVVASRDRP